MNGRIVSATCYYPCTRIPDRVFWSPNTCEPKQLAFGKYFRQQVGAGPKQYRNECVM